MKDPYKQWNRCDFCGRFIGFKDFDEGRAKRICYFDQASSWDPMPEEKYDTYHVECYEKEAAVEEDRKERERKLKVDPNEEMVKEHAEDAANGACEFLQEYIGCEIGERARGNVTFIIDGQMKNAIRKDRIERDPLKW